MALVAFQSVSCFSCSGDCARSGPAFFWGQHLLSLSGSHAGAASLPSAQRFNPISSDTAFVSQSIETWRTHWVGAAAPSIQQQ